MTATVRSMERWWAGVLSVWISGNGPRQTIIKWAHLAGADNSTNGHQGPVPVLPRTQHSTCPLNGDTTKTKLLFWLMMWILRANKCFSTSVLFLVVRQVRGVSKYLYFQFNACVSVWEWRVHVSELPWSVDTGYIYISTYLHIYNIYPVSSHPSGHQLGSPCYHSLVASSRVTGWVEYPIPGTMGTSSPALLYMIMEILFGNKGKFSRPSMIYNMEVTKTKMNICCSKTRILFIKNILYHR